MASSKVKTIVQDVTTKDKREIADDELNTDLHIGWEILDLTVFQPVYRDGIREIQRMVTLFWRVPKMEWDND